MTYAAPFAGEQLHSLTTSLSKAMQSLRRLARELAKPGTSFTERGLRNRIARWLSPQFVGELISYQLLQQVSAAKLRLHGPAFPPKNYWTSYVRFKNTTCCIRLRATKDPAG